MEVPAPAQLLAMVSRLEAGGPLMERLRAETGVHLVGGAVRDLLLGGAPEDLDLVVEGNGESLVSRLGGPIVRHERFGTWTVRLGGFSYDIAQARRETYAHPGALPEVAPASLSEDLLRRDFTVNAMAISLGGPEAGRMTAVPDAVEDLRSRRLRILHDRSFLEDPTRMLRLVRYRARLGFEAEEQTRRLLADAVANDALTTVSGSRVGVELRLLAHERDPLAGLRVLGELGLDKAIHPLFGLGRDEALAKQALALLPADGRRDRLVLAVAGRRIPAPELRQLLDRLAFEAEDREAIIATALRGEDTARTLAATARPSEIAEVADGLPLELIALAGALGAQAPARDWLERLRHVGLEIGGSDLLAAGVPEGPAIGRGLRVALAAKLDGRVQDREAELTAALEGAQASG